MKSKSGVVPEPVVDRDTLNLAGAVSINDAVFAKIRDADAFVADVSLINVDAELPLPARPTPNPNVLTELGYALGQPHLGHEALVLVVNTHYGSLDQLPFDVRPLRKLDYRLGPNDDRAKVKADLQRKLVDAIEEIGKAVRGDPVDTIVCERTLNVAGQARGFFRDLALGAGAMQQGEAADPLFYALSRQQLATICQKVDPRAAGPLTMNGGPAQGGRQCTWLEVMRYWQSYSRTAAEAVLKFSPFLRREHVALLMRVEYSSYFEHLDVLPAQVTNVDLTWISSSMFDYFQSAIRLEQYVKRELSRRVGAF